MREAIRMFGMLRPEFRGLTGVHRRDYSSLYCNLCGHLRQLYGLKSRLLVVHDIVTLEWLFRPAEEQTLPYPQVNCIRVRGKACGEVPARWAFLAAASAYIIGIKLQDDEIDRSRVQGRAMAWLYHDTLARAGHDLQSHGFDVKGIQIELSRQVAIERRCESRLDLAAEPTGNCYGSVALEIARLTGSPLSTLEAKSVGEALGQAVYALDALRDFTDDCGNSYNPLRAQVDDLVKTIPYRLRLECQRFIVRCLETCKKVFNAHDLAHQERWDLVAHRIVQLIGFPKKDVVLHGICCLPCGDGAVGCDTKECGGPICCCCCCTSCIASKCIEGMCL
jgi:hypothetical protein